MNQKPGFDAIRDLMCCVSVEELDFAISVINNMYPVVRLQLETKCYNDLGLSVGFVKLKRKE